MLLSVQSSHATACPKGKKKCTTNNPCVRVTLLKVHFQTFGMPLGWPILQKLEKFYLFKHFPVVLDEYVCMYFLRFSQVNNYTFHKWRKEKELYSCISQSGSVLTNSLIACLAFLSVLASTTDAGAKFHNLALGSRTLFSLKLLFLTSLIRF